MQGRWQAKPYRARAADGRPDLSGMWDGKRTRLAAHTDTQMLGTWSGPKESIELQLQVAFRRVPICARIHGLERFCNSLLACL